jgi:hypothetical protein
VSVGILDEFCWRVALPLGLYNPRVEGVQLEYGVCCAPTTDAHPDIQLWLSPDVFRGGPSEAKLEAKSMASTDIAAPNNEDEEENCSVFRMRYWVAALIAGCMIPGAITARELWLDQVPGFDR